MSTQRIRMRDVVVILPGITGSVLSRKDGGDVWAFSGSAIWNAARSLGDSLKEMEVKLHDPRTAIPKTTLEATRLVSNFHGVFGLGKIDGYTDLRRMVTDHFSVVEEESGGGPANIFEFPYDWRLSNRTSAERLRDFIEPRLTAWKEHRDGDPDAKLILIAHSMGGLVARWYLEVLGGWEKCRALITFGTPYRGSVNSLNFISNGYKGRFLDLTDVLRSCPSVYELLPIYRCVQVDGAWKRPGESGIPQAVSDYVSAAAEFHQTIRDMVERNDKAHGAGRYHIFPFLGVGQPTLQSAVLAAGKLTAAARPPAQVDAALEGGDGTVPRVSGTPIELSDQLRETFFGDRHAALQRNAYALQDVQQRIRQMQARGLGEIRGLILPQRPTTSVDLDDLYLRDEPVTIRASVTGGAAQEGLVADLEPEAGGPSTRYTFVPDGAGWALDLVGLNPGLYRIRVRAALAGDNAPLPVQDVFAVDAG